MISVTSTKDKSHFLDDYRTNAKLNKQYQKNNISVANWVMDSSNPALLPMDDVTHFESTVKEIKTLKESNTDLLGKFRYDNYLAAACKQFEFMTDALELVGFAEIERLKYKLSDVKRRIAALSPKVSETSDLVAISTMLQLNRSFSFGSILTV